VTARIELQERARRAPGKRIRGARYNPTYDPETTIGDDLDAPVELDVTPDRRLF